MNNKRPAAKVVSEPSDDSSLGWDPDADAADRSGRAHDANEASTASPPHKRLRDAGFEAPGHEVPAASVVFRFRPDALAPADRDELAAVSSSAGPARFECLAAATTAPDAHERPTYEVEVPQWGGKRAMDVLLLWLKGLGSAYALADALAAAPPAPPPPTPPQRAAMRALFSAALADPTTATHGLARDGAPPPPVPFPDDPQNGATPSAALPGVPQPLPPPAAEEPCMGYEAFMAMLIDACQGEPILPPPAVVLPPVLPPPDAMLPLPDAGGLLPPPAAD